MKRERKSSYALKSERSESTLGTPRTPTKKTPFKHYVITATPLDLTKHEKINANTKREDSLLTLDSCSDMEVENISSSVFAIKSEATEIFFDDGFYFRGCGNSDYMEENFEIVSKIGEGDYCEVFVVKKKMLVNNAMEFACIKRNRKKYGSETDRKNRLKEIEILFKLKGHSNIIEILSCWEQHGILFIETEFCNFGTLRDLIDDVYFMKKSRFSFKLVKKIILEIAEGLKAMHSNGIVHFDLKPENIFLKGAVLENSYSEKSNCPEPEDINSFIVKIGDFNVSGFEGKAYDEEGDKKYMAPEVLINEGCTFSDIYSLGLIYLEIIKEIILPTSGENWNRLRKNDFRRLGLESLSYEKRFILQKMIDKNYYKRPTAKEVVRYFLEREDL